MMIKKLKLPTVLLIVTIIAYIAATLIFCYTTKPEITKGEFPFSITYEYKGETKTFSGVFECKYAWSNTIHGQHDRYWFEETRYSNAENVDDPRIVESNAELETTLAIHENMNAGYFMGDPIYKDHYLEYGLEGPEPYIEYFDYKNDISLVEENKEEILDSIGFKIIDFTYAEPIENSFSFSGISYEADNIMIFVTILLLYFFACLFFVRKDKEYKYSLFDQIGIVVNFILGLVVIPFITFICMLFGIVESGPVIITQILYNVPALSILSLALSVVFRRKGYSKTGFFIQFAGSFLFVLILVLDAIRNFC